MGPLNLLINKTPTMITEKHSHFSMYKLVNFSAGLLLYGLKC